MKKQARAKGKNLAVNVVVIFIILVVFFLGFITVREMFNKSKLDNEITELQDEIDELKVQKQGLLTLIDAYKDDFYIEQEARTKLNLKKPGENVIVVKLDAINQVQDLETTNVPAVNQVGETQLAANNARLWWDYFFAAN